MSCGLSTKLDAAVAAAREAFDAAHENDSLSDSDLNLLFVYYQGLKKIKESVPAHSEGVFTVDPNTPVDTFGSDPFTVENNDYITFPDGTHDIDFDNINLDLVSATQAADTVEINYGGGVKGGASDDVVIKTTNTTDGIAF
tara:strand:+ start:918 stop:1340 length:423 start_codon:yes stop_codon:yes gene_type:complete